jgi:signal transduction histidine kinase
MPPSYDDIAARARVARKRARTHLYVLNIATGWGLGHVFFTLLVMSVSPRLHDVMQQSAVLGPVVASTRATMILLEPGYLWGGLVASVVGAASGWFMGWFQVRVLDQAGELVRDAEFERDVAHRTVDLTTHNQRMAELNAHLEEARKDLESRHRELRDTQEKLLRSERLAAITETAVSVNHEINGPLMVILGQSQILQRELAPGGTGGGERRLRVIEEQSLRIAEITRKLAALVEPVTGPYLEEEGIRMVDLERSKESPELAPASTGA